MINNIKLPPQELLGYDPERGDIHGYTFEQMREFAESIVLECAEISAKHWVLYKGCSAHFSIREHFGVEYVGVEENERTS